ncbi:ABC transporter permease [Cellulomonas biazotea]|uniref:ABC transporter permease n=3 Tax=Cellulomonas biazotea TaxID=1709 RepID=UPI0035EDC678
MLRLTLAQMRKSVGRLSAAAVAIAIGTAFLAATLVAGDVMQRTGYDSVTATYAQADLVVSDATTDDLGTIRATPGVEAAAPLVIAGTELTHGGRSTYQVLLPQPDDPRLESVVVAEGTMPTTDGEIALPQTTADRLEASVGDELASVFSVEQDGEWVATEEQVTLVGIVDDPAGAWAMWGGAGIATPDDLARWGGFGDEPVGADVLVVSDGSAKTQAALAAALPEAEVLTKSEAAQESIEQVTGNGNVLLMVVLGFAAIALLVASLVIANTFQVLVAQRARTLALLRCVGAVKGQLRRSVLLEAGILGIVASAIGVLLGLGLSQATLAVLARMDTGVPMPTGIDVTVVVIAVPLLVGTVVTALASLVPARAATRVSPVAALRPVDAPTVAARAGLVRLVFSLLLVVGGVGGLLLAVVASVGGEGDPMLALAGGVLAGALSFVGVLLSAVFWLPRVVSLVGRALAATGTSTRLAAANSVRNPRRTAATSTALLIGVTLVVLMSTGAASARQSLFAELDDHYPVDLTVASTLGSDAIPASTIADVEAVDGVARVVEVPSVAALVDDEYVVLRAPEPSEAATVLRNSDVLTHLDDDTIVVPTYRDEKLDGTVVSVVEDTSSRETSVPGDEADEPAAPVELTAVYTSLAGVDMVVTPDTLARIAPEAPTSMLWVGLEPGADGATTALAVMDTVGDGGLVVESAASERQQYAKVIDSLLAVVVGLLGVAVVIALVGVANTLSLSVIERRRESATLRAIGMTRRQLRLMLAVEGMLIAGIGALLGVGMGLLYGWAGAAIVLGNAGGDMHLSVPWRDLLLVLVVALAAGLLASVLPGRAAARTSPVAALAVD